MLRYELRFEDVGAIRFAISPLSETTRSLRVLRAPDAFPHLRPWAHHAARSVGQVDPVLSCLVNHRLWTPDCLTPRPRKSQSAFEDELSELRAVDPGVLVKQMRHMHGLVPPVLRGHPDPLGAIADKIQLYWSRVMEPQWDRMRRTLEADIAYRGRVITRHGIVKMLNTLSPELRVSGRLLAADVALNRTEKLDGRTMVLMPSVFSRGVSTPTDPGEPLILYAARGTQVAQGGTEGCRPDEALARLIGERRSELLRMLSTPASSTELAHRLGLSVSAVNQHLQVLRGARLLGSSRQGRHVIYDLTPLGEALATGRPD